MVGVIGRVGQLVGRVGQSASALPAGGGYIPEAQALFGRMVTQPDANRKALINDLINALIGGGVWAKLDALYLMAAHDAQAARLNWIQDRYNLTAVSAPLFTVDRGYAGDGVASYLETGFNPAVAVDRKFSQNDASLSFWSRTIAAGDGIDMGNDNSLILLFQRSTQNFAHRCNASSSGTSLTSDGSGDAISNRTGPLNSDGGGFRNGVRTSNTGSLSAPPSNNPIRILGRSGVVSYSTRQCACAHIGGGFTDQDITLFYNARRAYLQAVGAAQ